MFSVVFSIFNFPHVTYMPHTMAGINMNRGTVANDPYNVWWAPFFKWVPKRVSLWPCTKVWVIVLAYPNVCQLRCSLTGVCHKPRKLWWTTSYWVMRLCEDLSWKILFTPWILYVLKNGENIGHMNHHHFTLWMLYSVQCNAYEIGMDTVNVNMTICGKSWEMS